MTAAGRSSELASHRDDKAELAGFMAQHGELMDGRALATLFKFGSSRSFRRAAQKGGLPVSVFRVAGRRGWFARTRDVANWLATVAEPPGRPGL